MKTSNKILTGLFLAIFIAGIAIMSYMKANTFEVTPIKPVGEVRTENINIPYLKNLDAAVGTIYLANGDPKIEVSCTENIHQLLEKGYEDGTFFIRKKEGVMNRMKVVIHVFSNDLERINLQDRAELFTEEEDYQTNKLSIEANDRSKSEISLNVDELTLKASNSGKIGIKGTTNILNASSSNSGRIYGKYLKANEVDAFASNSARIETQAIKKLAANVSQAAKIRYYGAPENLESNISQAGELTRKDLDQ